MSFDLRSWLIGFALGLAGKPLPLAAAKKPVGYLYRTRVDRVVSYNGVEHPDIDTVWTDKETYPYAMVYYWKNFVSKYVLMLSQTEPYYSGGDIKVSGGNSMLYQKSYSGWSLFSETADTRSVAAASLSDVWTSHDIVIKDTTEVYMAGSDPVVTWPDAEVIVDGIGYKNMVLPELPERDKAKYPYAVIVFYGSLDPQILEVYFLAELTPYESNPTKYLWYAPGDKVYRSERSADSTDYFPAFGEGEILTESKIIAYENMIWSGTDLCIPGGTLYLAASDPVPVYE